MIDPIEREPRRLVEQDTSVGRLLRQANEQYVPSRSWLEAAMRRGPPSRSGRFGLGPLILSAATAAALTAVVVWQVRPDEPDAALTAEATTALVPASGEARSVGGYTPPRADQAGVPLGAGARAAEPSARPEPVVEPVVEPVHEADNADALEVDRAEPDRAEPDAVLPPEAERTVDPEPKGGAQVGESDPASGTHDNQLGAEGALLPDKADCLTLVRSGEPRRAEACFRQQASGQGLDAEVGLYELARLRRDALGDTAGALRALEDHRRRFPGGALRAEVDASYLSLLVRVGRASEALAESERILGSSAGAERAYELRMLRGQLLQNSLGSLDRARAEFELAEQAPGARAEASYYHGVSLEGLGQLAAARAAYERYLAKAPSGRHAADVKQRLERLSSQ